MLRVPGPPNRKATGGDGQYGDGRGDLEIGDTDRARWRSLVADTTTLPRRKKRPPVMQVTPLTKIIFLSGFLAAGFLLIILSCALWSNWYPLYVVGIFLLAPLPNTILTRSEFDDFMSDSSSSVNDFATFVTAMLVASGICLPVVLYHTGLVVLPATLMSTAGGLLIYTSIIVFTMFFQEQQDEF